MHVKRPVDPAMTRRLVLTPVGHGDVDDLAGRGYATELGRAALVWAGEHHPDLPIVACTEVHNRASRAVMERLGMRSAGTIRRDGLVEGRVGIHPDAPFALYRFCHTHGRHLRSWHRRTE
ncbi:GNAT family N-acetyltransferase [Actinoplanes sp. NPDC000266]